MGQKSSKKSSSIVEHRPQPDLFQRRSPSTAFDDLDWKATVPQTNPFVFGSNLNTSAIWHVSTENIVNDTVHRDQCMIAEHGYELLDTANSASPASPAVEAEFFMGYSAQSSFAVASPIIIKEESAKSFLSADRHSLSQSSPIGGKCHSGASSNDHLSLATASASNYSKVSIVVDAVSPQRRPNGAAAAARAQERIQLVDESKNREEPKQSLPSLNSSYSQQVVERSIRTVTSPVIINAEHDAKRNSASAATSTSGYSSASAVAADVIDTSPQISVYIYINQSKYFAATEMNVYSIYYVDLTELEYCSLQTNSYVGLRIDRNAFRVVNDQICIHRINEPINTLPALGDCSIYLADTESILFSCNEPLMAKYRGAYYFVHEELCDEYMNLQMAADSACTAIRIQRQRIIVNDETHVLDVIERPDFFRTNRQVFIIEPYLNANDAAIWNGSDSMTDELNTLHRYVANPHAVKCEFTQVPNELVYSGDVGSYAEIYGEIDYASVDDGEFQKHEFMKSFDRQRLLRMLVLPTFSPSAEIKEIVQCSSQRKLDTNNDVALSIEGQQKRQFITTFKAANGIHADNYKDSFTTMIQLEDETERVEVDSFNQMNCELKEENTYGLYSMSLNMDFNIFEAFDAAVSNKRIYAVILQLMEDTNIEEQRSSHSRNRRKKAPTYRGVVSRICDGKLFMEMDKNLKCLGPQHLYCVRFIHTRLPYQMSQMALNYVHMYELYPFLFPMGPFGLPITDEPVKSIKWFDNNLNTEQRMAVRNIIHKSSVPYPFILFGPPGTGKTKTLVEAIAQIASTSDAKILVCATSNAACDVLASRLLNLLPHCLLYRLYSKMANVMNIEDNIRRSSNVDDGDAFYPALDSLQKVQILVCTLVVAGRLAQAALPRKCPRHFTYVFIDECGSADEASALIPIAGVCSEMGSITANIVLAGDPFQLRAIINSPLAQRMGYDISLIERLMKANPYCRGCDGLFNNRYIVQLVKNYRSHAAILTPSNELFYRSQLVPRAKLANIDWFLNTAILPSPQFPIVFQSVQGKCRHGDVTSLYNNQELQIILSLVRKLLQGDRNVRAGKFKRMHPVAIDDIGIISPYKRQCRNIVSACKHNGWPDIKVGSVEIFQGQEKPVIIVSTVRSQMETIGFLNNWRRLNVLMTRAKCLLYLIGDPFTLALDENWACVLEYLQSNNAIIQSKNRFII